MTYSRDQVVLVEWVDSFHSPGWESLEDKLRGDRAAGSCRSVGWVLEDSEEWLAITQGWSGAKSVDGVLFIPRVAVRSVKAIYDAGGAVDG